MSMGVPPARGHLQGEAVRASASGEALDRPVIVASTPAHAEAVANRMAWLTDVPPESIWPTLAAARERSEPVDTWKADVFERVRSKIDRNRLASH
jgi:hypothetical protein